MNNMNNTGCYKLSTGTCVVSPQTPEKSLKTPLESAPAHSLRSTVIP